MAFVFNRQFEESTEQKMQAFFQTLSEKDRRRYAAIEAVKLEHGGIAYLPRRLLLDRFMPGANRRSVDDHGNVGLHFDSKTSA